MQQKELSSFQYKIENTGNMKYINLDSPQPILPVVFDVSPYGKYKKTIYLNNPVPSLKTPNPLITFRHAITMVEKFLSEPLTEEYYNEIRDDLVDKNMDWTEAQNKFSIKGDLLGEIVKITDVSRWMTFCNIKTISVTRDNL